MKVRIISDLHTEFWSNDGGLSFFRDHLFHYLPIHPDDKDTVLVCAGDMGTFSRWETTYHLLFAFLSPRFRQVVVVPGNHSYYRSKGIWGQEEKFWRSHYLPENIAYLDNQAITIDEVTFICSCAWTDFHDSDPKAMALASSQMNDFRLIYAETDGVLRKLSPEMTVERHLKSIAFIRGALDENRNKKCFIVTHHAPSPRSVPQQYQGDSLNPAFFTDLSSLILAYQPVAWAHGHMHDSQSYHIDQTAVICNPLGYYPNALNPGFDPELFLVI
ncbi:metallophosphoesterase [Geomonas sp. Red69]|uniref:metallophosphoesterase n=1 Tax=Geomonas diazotrophica TaxID=2843197 RepID=UPI001C0F57D8|nr:metallophosphoesterase [Geomonas diazotrophica]MBU5635114.1 metallophosphoesterase [Geomonas diazotrophica]